MAIENDLTRIAVALEGILAHLKARPVMPELHLTATSAEEPKPAENNQALAAEPPKKKRGRPSKAELEARVAAPVVAEAHAELAAVSESAPATALPVEVGNEGIPPTEEKPKCPDCGEVLHAENSSKSHRTGKLMHVGCKAESAKKEELAPVEVPKLTIEKVRSEAIAFVQSKGDAGREALVAVLAKFSAKSISELPEPKWPEFVAQMKAA